MSVSKEDAEKKSSSATSIFSYLTNALKKVAVVGIVYFVGYMQWSVAWFVGPVILVVIKDQWNKDKQRRRLIAQKAALSDEKDVVLARLDDLPAWVFFPDVERVEWLNRIIKQVWPNVNHYARELIRDVIQPNLRKTLENYKLSGFKFERIILGTVPFRIGGVKVFDKNVSRNEIIMDLDISYAGDCDITFFLGGVKGGIRDFELSGTLRVVMKPLITSMPLFGGLQVFFLNNPDIDFDLVGIADLLDMPGLSDMLRRIVVETVASMMVLPNKFPIKLSDEVEAAELKAPEPEGVLRVHVIEAKHLMKKDIGMLGKGKSDPYAIVTVGAQEFKTQVIDNTVDPKWDFWCEFNVLESNGQQLYIHLWDKDDASDDEPLGRATIEVANIVKKGEDDMWVTLEQAKHGMVHLRLTWLTLSKNYTDLKAALEETQLLRVTTMSTAILTIFIDSAKNLPQAKSTRKPDPYVVLQVGKIKHHTNKHVKTCDPVWEEGFTFLVANPESDTLYVSVMDEKTNTELCQLIFNINNLSKKQDMEVIKQPFSLQKSGIIVWSMHLRILKHISLGQLQGDDSSLQRSDSTISNSSNPPLVKQSSSMSVTSVGSQQQQQTLPEEIVELIEDSSVPLVASDLISEEHAQHLIHRSPSVTSSAGESGLGRIQLTLRYSIQRQRLIIVVHRIANIPMKDTSNIPDPYVKLYLLPERAKDSKRKTQTIKDNCNPVFDESFEYLISQGDVSSKQLQVTACTLKALFSSSNVLGQVVIDLAKLNLAQPYSAWFDLQPEAD